MIYVIHFEINHMGLSLIRYSNRFCVLSCDLLTMPCGDNVWLLMQFRVILLLQVNAVQCSAVQCSTHITDIILGICRRYFVLIHTVGRYTFRCFRTSHANACIYRLLNEFNFEFIKRISTRALPPQLMCVYVWMCTTKSLVHMNECSGKCT